MNKPVDTGTNSNDGEFTIVTEEPVLVDFVIKGTTDILFHRWSNEDVAAKAAAARGSKAKKTDNLESYVWRDEEGMVCLPGQYVRRSVVETGRFVQDPRSARKTAYDLFNAAFVPITLLAPLGPKWEIEDKRRMVVSRQGITRTSPGFKAGWEAEFRFELLLPEYVTPELFLDSLVKAGKLVGLGQYRPTYGRFQVVKFSKVT